jgi:membrane protease YdiL (CAAX protease family)
LTGPFSQDAGAIDPALPREPDAPVEPEPEPEPEPEAGPDTEPDADATAEPAPPARPESRTFSLEGRRAPGLYLVGWLATVLGGSTLLAAVLAASDGFGGLVLTLGGSSILGLGLIAAAGAQAIERRDRADLAYRGPWPGLVFVASVPLTILAALPVVLLGLDASAPLATLLSVCATDAIWLALIALTVVGTGALRWSDIAPGISRTPLAGIGADVVLGALAAIPVLLATGLITGALVQLVGSAPEGSIPVPHDGVSLVVVLLAAAVVAPIGEEIFYRGFVTTAWARGLGPTTAIVRGGLFFALVHVLTIGGSDFSHASEAALIAFAARIPIGLTLGWIFLRRRSLPASIALHATFNTVLVLLAYASLAS